MTTGGVCDSGAWRSNTPVTPSDNSVASAPNTVTSIWLTLRVLTGQPPRQLCRLRLQVHLHLECCRTHVRLRRTIDSAELDDGSVLQVSDELDGLADLLRVDVGLQRTREHRDACLCYLLAESGGVIEDVIDARYQQLLHHREVVRRPNGEADACHQTTNCKPTRSAVTQVPGMFTFMTSRVRPWYRITSVT